MNRLSVLLAFGCQPVPLYSSGAEQIRADRQRYSAASATRAGTINRRPRDSVRLSRLRTRGAG